MDPFLYLGLNLLNSLINYKHQKSILKQTADFENCIQQKNAKATKERFDELCKAKKDILEQEFEAQTEHAKNIHRNNLRDIEYLSTLKDWPLFILPMAMHNEQLVLSNDNFNEYNYITPLSVITGPCRDSAFQDNIWDKTIEHLSNLMQTYWSTFSSHPIIFYQDAWKDPKTQIDNIHTTNIFNKISFVPTVIISPIVTKDKSLQVNVTYWSIINLYEHKNAPESLMLRFPSDFHHFKRNDNYSDIDCDSIAHDLAMHIAINIGIISDIYMWNKFRTLPIIPSLIKTGTITNNDNYGSLKEIYCKLFYNSLYKTADINAIIDLNTALDFCHTVDDNDATNNTFPILCDKLTLCENCFTQKNIFNKIPNYSNTYLVPLYEFCKKYQETYSIDNESIKELHTLIVFNKLIPMVKKCIVEKYSFPNNYYSSPIESIHQRINNLVNEFNSHICTLLQSFLDSKIQYAIEFRQQLYDLVVQSYTKEINSIIEEVNTDCFDYAKNGILSILHDDLNIAKYKFGKKQESNLINRIINSVLESIELRQPNSELINSVIKQNQVTNILSDFADNIRYACIEINIFSDNNLRESIDQTFLDSAVNKFKLLPDKSIEIINDYFKRILAQSGFLNNQDKYNSAWHQTNQKILNPYLTVLSFGY